MPEFLKKTSTANLLIIAALVGLVAFAIYNSKKTTDTAAGGNDTETGGDA